MTSNKQHSYHTGCGLAIVMAGALVIGACNQAPPEERLQAAADALQDTATTLDDVTDEIDRLETELEFRRKQQRQLTARQQTLEERVAARATDVALFRAVQSAVLELDSLQNVAVEVSVADRHVTLRGSVEDPEQVTAAVDAARNTPGVTDVRSRLIVESPDETAASSQPSI